MAVGLEGLARWHGRRWRELGRIACHPDVARRFLLCHHELRSMIEQGRMEWMFTPQGDFDGRTPEEMLWESHGLEQVMDVIRGSALTRRG